MLKEYREELILVVLDSEESFIGTLEEVSDEFIKLTVIRQGKKSTVIINVARIKTIKINNPELIAKAKAMSDCLDSNKEILYEKA